MIFLLLSWHFTFRLEVYFQKMNKRAIPDPYSIPPARELNKIAKKKVYKTCLDLKYGFGAMEFYRDHILVLFSDWRNHLESLREVFQRTSDAKLRIIVEKVRFALFSIEYAGSTSQKMG
jgi:hypothetical protein